MRTATEAASESGQSPPASQRQTLPEFVESPRRARLSYVNLSQSAQEIQIKPQLKTPRPVSGVQTKPHLTIDTSSDHLSQLNTAWGLKPRTKSIHHQRAANSKIRILPLNPITNSNETLDIFWESTQNRAQVNGSYQSARIRTSRDSKVKANNFASSLASQLSTSYSPARLHQIAQTKNLIQRIHKDKEELRRLRSA